MITRRDLLGAALALAALPSAAGRRRARICMILPGAETALEHGFHEQLASLRIDAELLVRDAGPGMSKVPAILREARSRGTDLIYTSGTTVTLAVAGPPPADPARHVTDIPVVFAGLSEYDAPAFAGPARARNVTGTTASVPLETQVAAMLAYRPFTRIAVIANPASEGAMRAVAVLRALGLRHGFELIERHPPLDRAGVPIASSLTALVAAIARQGAQALYLGAEQFMVDHRRAVMQAATAQRLATFSPSEQVLRDGQALFGLAVNLESLGRHTARKAAAILVGGAAPSSIPVDTLARPSLMINMPVAAALELYPPVSLLNKAEVLRHGLG
ncbi:MAG TPA: ABC transporter substrate binding protein [Telluria sp.]|nr:ABC transporter substrate binding protein [Telluria sp.]